MKILYGVQGTGNGHISRSRLMAKALKAQGLEVKFLLSGRAKSALFDMEDFGAFWHRRGLTFCKKDGHIDHLSTVKNNNLWQFVNEARQLDLSAFDLIISDFEPVTSWAAKWQKREVLGIGHQYAFGKQTPRAKGDRLSHWLLNNFAPATQHIGLHWHRFEANILPPIIDTQIQSTPQPNLILVYLPFENQQKITKLLNQFTDFQFVQFSPELTAKQLGNVEQYPTSLAVFKHWLTQATAVICNAGFELISECLHLGLSILAKPMLGQLEQESNALALQQLGLAYCTNNINAMDVSSWLKSLTDKNQKQICFPDVATALSQYIAAPNNQTIEQISAQLWHQVNNPTRTDASKSENQITLVSTPKVIA